LYEPEPSERLCLYAEQNRYGGETVSRLSGHDEVLVFSWKDSTLACLLIGQGECDPQPGLARAI